MKFFALPWSFFSYAIVLMIMAYHHHQQQQHQQQPRHLVAAFIMIPPNKVYNTMNNNTASQSLWASNNISNDNNNNDKEEEEATEPGKMKVSEMKAELDLRGVAYDDCFDKDSLQARLLEARATGKANPDILNKFNKQKLEDTFNERKLEVSDEQIDMAVANDGKLPGGMKPEQFRELMNNPQVMALLQNSKMQEAMRLLMTGGPKEVEKALDNDPELCAIVKQLKDILGM